MMYCIVIVNNVKVSFRWIQFKCIKKTYRQQVQHCDGSAEWLQFEKIFFFLKSANSQVLKFLGLGNFYSLVVKKITERNLIVTCFI